MYSLFGYKLYLTYEELTQIVKTREKYVVLVVPYLWGIDTESNMFVGNGASIKIPSRIFVVPYLWGIDTIFNNSFCIPTFSKLYLTYEELTPSV